MEELVGRYNDLNMSFKTQGESIVGSPMELDEEGIQKVMNDFNKVIVPLDYQSDEEEDVPHSDLEDIYTKLHRLTVEFNSTLLSLQKYISED
ncbi:hypothetical protein CYMTET_10805 [Cymbomonas tetramitiformis]|uniref:Uncharacterized protein n=1 Tax=Cymbomonas tetramitiformis TaxID=36881 RepID=A0AAE0LE36_9CHLO|nr:hypothetical protein CYMTET_10805 [Cymbomonas tetramitiformis]